MNNLVEIGRRRRREEEEEEKCVAGRPLRLEVAANGDRACDLPTRTTPQQCATKRATTLQAPVAPTRTQSLGSDTPDGGEEEEEEAVRTRFPG